MDIQSTLTQAIEFIVMSFVALMIFDFIDGLYVVPLPAIVIAQSSTKSESTASVTAPQLSELPLAQQLKVEPQQIPLVTPKFEEIPDPWTLEADSYKISTQAVILPFPTLRLLPPVKQQLKSTKNSQKSHLEAKNKSSDLTDVGLNIKRKPGRPKKVA
ncbi:MAG: hypothetical protein V7K88_00425 [Nostoc sp.]|uniref:hypothetical protein n=1 Tax=Nostoc sp. TaxID=1180 RepID=UPI002FF84CBB